MGALSQLKDELKYEIFGIALVALGVLGIVCLLSPDAGLVSGIIDKALKSIAGEGRYIFPFLLILIGAKLVRSRTQASISERMYGVILLFLVALAFFHLVIPVEDAFSAGFAGDGGGLIGALISFICRKSFGIIGTYVILITLGLIAMLLLTNLSTAAMVKGFSEKVRGTIRNTANRIMNFLFEEVEDKKETEPAAPVIIDHEGEQFSIIKGQNNIKEKREKERIPVLTAALKKNVDISSDAAEESVIEAPKEIEETFALFAKDYMPELSSFQLPPISILARPHRIKNIRLSKDINENIRILEETLESFGVKAKILHVSRGPAITRYEIQPPSGVKVSRIVALADDIALSMAAPDVRIEAPIPGKAAVGIEVPNKEISMVHLRDLLESQEFVQSASKLTIALGKDIAGNPEVADLAKMPHLLIAGATGSGKSVCLNTLIASILFKATPDEVKLLMIDPKMVELATYNGIPHLVNPVVTDPKKAATALRWAVREMERRYELFAQAGVRDITRYNKLFKKEPGGGLPLPLIVVIIDELADLMMVAPADVEDAVCRLAQMARAAGIHLVVATQRPSVDVITGLIKANIPSRISFAVSSQIDSRTILDMAGAEKLLGKGDMLFYPVGAPKPVRIQGPYLSDREVEDLVNYLKKQAEPVYDEKILTVEPEEEAMPEMEDELLAQAVRILIESGHASISMLQRRLHIGYARAARLIDMMEQRGIVGGYEGSKPRSILMTLDQYNQVFRKAK
jgi:S-DNA-T family DNA segregation ATPase FtsK/SpoIIIE